MVTYCLQYLFILFVLCYIYFFNLLSLKKGSYSALQNYWNSKDKNGSVGCGVKTFTNMIKRWIWDKTTECHILLLGDSTQMFYQLRSSALLEFIPLSDVSISIGTVASQVFLSDQLCPVALILQVLKAGNVSDQLYHYFCILNLAFDDDTHQPGWRRGSWLWEKSKQFGC